MVDQDVAAGVEFCGFDAAVHGDVARRVEHDEIEHALVGEDVAVKIDRSVARIEVVGEFEDFLDREFIVDQAGVAGNIGDVSGLGLFRSGRLCPGGAMKRGRRVDPRRQPGFCRR